MPFDPSTAKLTQQQPQENLSLHSSDPSMQKTISDIESGKPAPSLKWQGMPMGKHGQVFDPSTVKPSKTTSPKETKATGFDPSTAKPVQQTPRSVAEKVVGNVASILDLISGTGPFIAKTAAEITGSFKKRVLPQLIDPANMFGMQSDKPIQEANKDASDAFDKFFGGYSKLANTLFKDKHVTEESSAQHIQNRIGELLSKPVEYTEQHYGKEAAAYVKQMEDFLMVVGPAKAHEVIRGMTKTPTIPKPLEVGELAKKAEDIKEATKVTPKAEEPIEPPETLASISPKPIKVTPPEHMTWPEETKPTIEGDIHKTLESAAKEGYISQEGHDLAKWVLDKNPQWGNDLSVSVKQAPKGELASGRYNPIDRVITLFHDTGAPETATHEILHHTERMMPSKVRSSIKNEYIKQLTKALKTSTGRNKAFLDTALKAAKGSVQDSKMLYELVNKGAFDYDLYQFTNPSEFWAVNASRLLAKQYGAEGSIWKTAKNWLGNFTEKVKSVLRLPSDHPVLSAIKQMGKVSGEEVNKELLTTSKGAMASVEKPKETDSLPVKNNKIRIALGIGAVGTTAGYVLSPQGQQVEGAVLGGIGSILFARSLPKAATILKEDFRGAIAKAAVPAAMIGGGVYFNPDRKLEGALAGLGLWGWGELPKSKPIQSGDLFRANFNNKIAMERLYMNMAENIKQKIPDQARRVEVITNYEKGITEGLSPEEKEVTDAWKSMMDSFAEAAKDADIMDGFIENYVPHIVEQTGQQGLLKQVMEYLGLDQVSSGGSRRFTKTRKYATFAELNDALEGSGLKVKTMDPAEILPTYGRAMTKAIEDKNLIEGLKGATVGGDKEAARLIRPTDKAPSDYKTVEGVSQLNGLRVHPEIVDPLRILLKGRSTNELSRAATNVNGAIKRLGVSFSLFHGKSLIEAALLAGGRKGVSPDGVKAALDMMHNGGLGDDVDFMIREGGLVLRTPEDVNRQSIENVGKMADELLQTDKFSKVGAKFDKYQRKIDRVTWDIFHTGLKANLALHLMNQWRGTKSFLGKDFSHLTEQEAARQISSFTNDTFGGLNWYQVFEESRTAMGRKMAASLLNPKGRDMLQLAIFAPDWTLSTLRAWYKAIPGYSGELNNVLASKYVLRTALIYGTLLNAVNYSLVGRPIWDNKDTTRIDLPDGRTMQVIKHSAEATELLQGPWKYASNKLAFFPQSALVGLTGKAYIGGPPVDSKLGTVLGKVAPFGAQSLMGTSGTPASIEGLQRALAGEFGFGLYGQTKLEKERRQRDKARQAERKARRKDTR